MTCAPGTSASRTWGDVRASGNVQRHAGGVDVTRIHMNKMVQQQSATMRGLLGGEGDVGLGIIINAEEGRFVHSALLQ